MEDEKKANNGSFNKDPHLILYGMPDTPIQDKWALLALIGMCWDRRQLGMTLKDLEGPYKLSLREIAAITGVKHNALRNSGGKDPRTGVLDRWQEIGYITVIEARPIDEMTGKPGRSQTYLYVHLERIWADNAVFTESWHRPPGRLVSEDSFERVVDADTVHVVNTQESPTTVHVVNNEVHHVNNEVHQGNSMVHSVNVTVHDASTNSDTRQSKKKKKEERKNEDDSSIHSSTLSSSSQKANVTAYLRIFMIRFLHEMEVTGKVAEDEELTYLQEVYYASGLDKEAFRFEAEKAIDITKRMKGNMDYFYECLGRALHLEQVS